VSTILELRFHGRAGQGAKSIADIFAEAALREGKHILAFPEYGAARQGAPLRVFVKIDDEKVLDHSQIEHPDIAIVLDEDLIHSEDVLEGLKEKGTLIVNTHRTQKEFREVTGYKGRLVIINATDLAIKIMKAGRLANTAILGALTKGQSLISKNDLKELLKKDFTKRFPKDIVKKNLELFDAGYKESEVFQ